MTDGPSRGLLDLPAEILIDVLEYLKVTEIMAFARVCRRAYEVTEDERIWRVLCARDYQCQLSITRVQGKASQLALRLRHLPEHVKTRLLPQSLEVVRDAGSIFGGMKAHYQQIQQIDSTKSILHGTIFKAAMEATFGYLVHSSTSETVGRELLSAVEHNTCEWNDLLLERVLDHSKIRENWKALLLCKIYWGCCLMESELSDYRKKHSFCLKESEGKVKIGVLLERTINRLSWAQTSEVLVDVLLILGAIPTNVVLKRCLHASFDDEASEAAFHRIFPKILFSLDYIPFVDEESYTTSTLSRYELDYGPDGDVYCPIHVVASMHRGKMLEYLVRHCGLDINQRTSHGNSPLSIILSSPVQRRYSSHDNGTSLLDVAKLAVQLGAEIDAIVIKATILHHHWEFLRLLIEEYQADMCVIFLDSSEQIQTPLQVALEIGQVDIALLLLEKGTEIFQCPNFKWLEHPLALSFFRASLRRSIDWKAIRNEHGSTIYHEVASGLYEVSDIRLIVEIVQCVPNTVTNWRGETPVQVLIGGMTNSTPLTLIIPILLAHFEYYLPSELFDPSSLDDPCETLVQRLQQLTVDTTHTSRDICAVEDVDEVTLMEKTLEVDNEPLKKVLLTLLNK